MKKIGLLLSLIIVSAAGLATSCTIVDMATNKTGWSDYTEITVKDFESLGIVRVTSKEIFEMWPFGFQRSSTGSKITYDMLISEAVKLGADDIINVRIDVTEKSKKHIFSFITGHTREVDYIGTALAIKYKTPAEHVGTRAGEKLGDSEMFRTPK